LTPTEMKKEKKGKDNNDSPRDHNQRGKTDVISHSLSYHSRAQKKEGGREKKRKTETEKHISYREKREGGGRKEVREAFLHLSFRTMRGPDTFTLPIPWEEKERKLPGVALPFKGKGEVLSSCRCS